MSYPRWWQPTGIEPVPGFPGVSKQATIFVQRNTKPQSGPRRPESCEPEPEAARRSALMIEFGDLRKGNSCADPHLFCIAVEV